MFLPLAHIKLDISTVSGAFVLSCYKETKVFRNEVNIALTQQIRKTALSVHLNLDEGLSRKSPAERKRFYDISSGSIIELDTAFDGAIELGYISKGKLTKQGNC
jgi:four helix bundle protein